MIIGSHNANVHARCALHSKDDALDRVHNTGVSAHHVHEAEILRQGRDAEPRASVQVAELAEEAKAWLREAKPATSKLNRNSDARQQLPDAARTTPPGYMNGTQTSGDHQRRHAERKKKCNSKKRGTGAII